MGNYLKCWFRLVPYTVAKYPIGQRLHSFSGGFFEKMTSIGRPKFVCFPFFDRFLLASSSFSAGIVRFWISFSVRGTISSFLSEVLCFKSELEPFLPWMLLAGNDRSGVDPGFYTNDLHQLNKGGLGACSPKKIKNLVASECNFPSFWEHFKPFTHINSTSSERHNSV